MARKAKKKTAKKKSKSKTRGVKRGKAKKSSKKRKVKARKSVGSTSAARKQQEPIPAEPAGRIGIKRPSNEPKAPGQSEPREIAQSEPDARFDDPRRPEADAREHPDGSMPPLERRGGYKNTDEQI